MEDRVLILVDLSGQLSNFCQDYGVISNACALPEGTGLKKPVKPITPEELSELKCQLLHPPEKLQQLLDCLYSIKNGHEEGPP
jgi:hypothetical protein